MNKRTILILTSANMFYGAKSGEVINQATYTMSPVKVLFSNFSHVPKWPGSWIRNGCFIVHKAHTGGNFTFIIQILYTFIFSLYFYRSYFEEFHWPSNSPFRLYENFFFLSITNRVLLYLLLKIIINYTR